MAKQTFTAGQVLTAAEMNSLQENDYNWTVTTKTASYTLAAGDEGTRIVMNNAGATTITVDDAVFAAGDVVWLHNIGAGTCTITAGTATVNTAASLDLAQWEGGSLYFTSASSAIFFRGPAGGVAVFAVDYLIVGGGGGGGDFGGGGGGGGGVIEGTTYKALGSFTVTVGAGGAWRSGRVGAYNGESSRFDDLYGVGGGGGGPSGNGAQLGGTGGSGGGSGAAGGGGGAGIAGQGFGGGPTGSYGGGGGGAGEAGSTDGTGYGGDGTIVTILSDTQSSAWSVGEVIGSDVYYGGGGGGGVNGTSAKAPGGNGGGGEGGNNLIAGAGTVNTGGGGGGEGQDAASGANGGSGVVILKWLTADASISVGAGLTSVNTTVGDYTVYAFTAGTDTVTFS